MQDSHPNRPQRHRRDCHNLHGRFRDEGHRNNTVPIGMHVDDSETKFKRKKLKESSVDHLNTIKPGVIEFTKEDQEGDTLPGII